VPAVPARHPALTIPADAAPPNDGALGERCTNNVDDDGDGHTDCADSEGPGATTRGAGCVCIGAGRIPTEVACADGLDNDHRDGPDCVDPDCPRCPGALTCCPDGARRTSC